MRTSLRAALGAVSLLLVVGNARTHLDPPSCSGIATSMGLAASRSDGVTPVVGTVTECETLRLVTSLSWVPPGCLFGSGSYDLTTPAGSTTIVLPLPCLGPATTDFDGCFVGQPTAVASAPIVYTVDPSHVAEGTVQLEAAWTSGVLHDVSGNTPGQGVTRTIALAVETCPLGCDPGATDGVRTGLCNTIPAPVTSTCTALKLKSSLKYSLALAKCQAKAVKRGMTTDPACIAAALTKLARNWTASEAKGDCLTTDDLAPIQAQAETCVSDIGTTLLVP